MSFNYLLTNIGHYNINKIIELTVNTNKSFCYFINNFIVILTNH